MKQVGNGKEKNKDMKKIRKINAILMCFFCGLLIILILIHIILFFFSPSSDIKSCIYTALSIIILIVFSGFLVNNIFMLRSLDVLEKTEKLLDEIREERKKIGDITKN